MAAPLLACGAIALAYIPPRGVPPEPEASNQMPRRTAARHRAQLAADRWRAAELAVRLARYRQRLRPELARLHEAGEARPALLFDGTDSIPAHARRAVGTALETVWRQLGLGVAQVSVGVVVDLSWDRDAVGTPKGYRASPAYLLPDSTDRTTCLVWTSAWYLTSQSAVSPPTTNRQLQMWLRDDLGPCAFFAAYGTPGNGVRQWLARRDYDLARDPSWDRDRPARPWLSGSVYDLSTTAIGCLGGRAESCRTAVLAAADDSPGDSLTRVLSTDSWWRRGERLVNSERYLADVAREVGRDRFMRFWGSTAPVDTALAAALGMPVGEWTEQWERRFVPRLPLGPAAPLDAAALGLLLAGGAVAIVALGARRRQVR
jgi:hypothetical protein